MLADLRGQRAEGRVPELRATRGPQVARTPHQRVTSWGRSPYSSPVGGGEDAGTQTGRWGESAPPRTCGQGTTREEHGLPLTCGPPGSWRPGLVTLVRPVRGAGGKWASAGVPQAHRRPGLTSCHRDQDPFSWNVLRLMGSPTNGSVCQDRWGPHLSPRMTHTGTGRRACQHPLWAFWRALRRGWEV